MVQYGVDVGEYLFIDLNFPSRSAGFVILRSKINVFNSISQKNNHYQSENTFLMRFVLQIINPAEQELKVLFRKL